MLFAIPLGNDLTVAVVVVPVSVTTSRPGGRVDEPATGEHRAERACLRPCRDTRPTRTGRVDVDVAADRVTPAIRDVPLNRARQQRERVRRPVTEQVTSRPTDRPLHLGSVDP